MINAHAMVINMESVKGVDPSKFRNMFDFHCKQTQIVYKDIYIFLIIGDFKFTTFTIVYIYN